MERETKIINPKNPVLGESFEWGGLWKKKDLFECLVCWGSLCERVFLKENLLQDLHYRELKVLHSSKYISKNIIFNSKTIPSEWVKHMFESKMCWKIHSLFKT